MSTNRLKPEEKEVEEEVPACCPHCQRIEERIESLQEALLQVQQMMEGFLEMITRDLQVMEGRIAIGGAEIVAKNRDQIRGHQSLLSNHEERLASLEWKTKQR